MLIKRKGKWLSINPNDGSGSEEIKKEIIKETMEKYNNIFNKKKENSMITVGYMSETEKERASMLLSSVQLIVDQLFGESERELSQAQIYALMDFKEKLRESIEQDLINAEID